MTVLEAPTKAAGLHDANVKSLWNLLTREKRRENTQRIAVAIVSLKERNKKKKRKGENSLSFALSLSLSDPNEDQWGKLVAVEREVGMNHPIPLSCAWDSVTCREMLYTSNRPIFLPFGNLSPPFFVVFESCSTLLFFSFFISGNYNEHELCPCVIFRVLDCDTLKIVKK